MHPAPLLGVRASRTLTPFCVLITCVLSLRTKDDTTRLAAACLFRHARTPRTMLRLGDEEIARAIYPVGFYRTKAQQILKICRRLLEVYHGRVPDRLEALVSLDGVGRKTANLVVSVAYRKPAICVDTHVHRICNRWGYVRTKDADATEVELRNILPQKYWMTFNELLVSFGQHMCRPTSPYCDRCSVSRICPRVGVTSSR